MSTLVFTNGTAVLPDQLLPDAAVICERGKFISVGKAPKRLPANAQIVDARGGYIAPGFVDVHVHGGGGGDFMDGTVESVRAASGTHAKHGTTTLFPTTTTGSTKQIHAMIEACRVAQKDTDIARIPGIHLYGPFFAADKVGAHPPEGRRDPTAEEFNAYFATGMIRIATCAAELPGAEDFFRAAKKHKCFLTCGHSNASWSEMHRAFKAGMRHVDHFWSAMSSVPSVRARFGTPMQGSMEQFVLMHEAMSTEVIADGYHVADELLLFAWKMLGVRRLFLVTDSCRAVDMPPGRYRIGNSETGTLFEFTGEAALKLTGGPASSAKGMDHMIRVMRRATGAPLHEIIRMASLTPAERTGLARQLGSLEVGKRADVAILSRSLNVRQVYRDGIQIAGPRE